eukprot:scaffold257_cov422-Prasinococcus_capsulatus_cf.AAC.4
MLQTHYRCRSAQPQTPGPLLERNVDVVRLEWAGASRTPHQTAPIADSEDGGHIAGLYATLEAIDGCGHPGNPIGILPTEGWWYGPGHGNGLIPSCRAFLWSGVRFSITLGPVAVATACTAGASVLSSLPVVAELCRCRCASRDESELLLPSVPLSRSPSGPAGAFWSLVSVREAGLAARSQRSPAASMPGAANGRGPSLCFGACAKKLAGKPPLANIMLGSSGRAPLGTLPTTYGIPGKLAAACCAAIADAT